MRSNTAYRSDERAYTTGLRNPEMKKPCVDTYTAYGDRRVSKMPLGLSLSLMPI